MYLILYEFINYTKSYTWIFTPPCSTCRDRKRLLTGHLKLKCVWEKKASTWLYDLLHETRWFFWLIHLWEIQEQRRNWYSWLRGPASWITSNNIRRVQYYIFWLITKCWCTILFSSSELYELEWGSLKKKVKETILSIYFNLNYKHKMCVCCQVQTSGDLFHYHAILKDQGLWLIH